MLAATKAACSKQLSMARQQLHGYAPSLSICVLSFSWWDLLYSVSVYMQVYISSKQHTGRSKENTDGGNGALHAGGYGHVVAMAAHPQISDLILSAHDSGLITLHSIQQSSPLRTWTAAADAGDLLAVMWDQHHPTHFYAVLQSGHVLSFDVNSTNSQAASTHKVAEQGVTSAAVGGSSWGEGERAAYMAVGCHDGSLRYHKMLPAATVSPEKLDTELSSLCRL